MKVVIVSLAVVLSAVDSPSLGAQEICGRVVDQSTLQPLQLVQVRLLRTSDSSRVSGTATLNDGTFSIANIDSGEYIIRLSLLGYAPGGVGPLGINRHSGRVDVGTLTLAQSPVGLAEVVVTGEKPIFSQEIDRKVYNVERDIAAVSGSASDLLRNIPSLEVDIEGNVSLRGSSDVLILINGRNSQLMGANRGEVLQQLPANTIERIEVITNPSTRYRPDGTAGIINIALKENADRGLNGSATVNGGREGRYGGNARLNYHPAATNLFAGYSIRRDIRNRSNTDYRLQNFGTPEMSTYSQIGDSWANPISHTATAGVEHQLSPSTDLGFSGFFFVNESAMNSHTSIVWEEGGVVSPSVRTNVEESTEDERGLKASLEHRFSGNDHMLQIDVQTSRESEDENTDAQTVFQTPGSPAEIERVRNTQLDYMTEVAADYSLLLGKGMRFESGYNAEFCAYEFGGEAWLFDHGRGAYLVDLSQTNYFLLDEALHAVYATYQHSLGRFAFKAGLRAEKVFRTSNLVTLATEVRSDYAALYPSMHLTYRPVSAVELQLNYSRRTRRPHGEDLNPFPEYRDPRNVTVGNPRLLPEYIHSIEFGCKLEVEAFTIVPGVYYRYTDNRFTSVVRPLNDSTLLTTEENLAADRSAGVELVLSGGMPDFCSVNASASGFYNTIDAGNLGYTTPRSVWSWGGSATCNVRVTSSTTLQVNGNYRSARLTPQGMYAPGGVVNIGVRQDFWDRKASLVVTVADLFRTMRRELDLDTPVLTQRAGGIRDAQVFLIGFTFRFGSADEAEDEDPLPYDNGSEQ